MTSSNGDPNKASNHGSGSSNLTRDGAVSAETVSKGRAPQVSVNVQLAADIPAENDLPSDGAPKRGRVKLMSLKEAIEWLGCLVCGEEVSMPGTFTRCTRCLLERRMVSVETWRRVDDLRLAEDKMRLGLAEDASRGTLGGAS
jgi:hypothetical protein